MLDKLTPLKKRFLLFLVGCMGSRYGLAYLSYNYESLNKYIALFTLVAGLGFYIIYFGRYRKTGIETGGQLIWWNKLRLTHGSIYLLFSYIVLIHNRCSIQPWKLLTLDATIGLISFLYYHTFGKI